MITDNINLSVQNHVAQFPIRDVTGRSFKKLRLSVLSACNFNCVYCDPEEDKGSPFTSKNITRISRHLSPAGFEEAVRRIHERVDLTSVRITGGEPLLYSHLPELITRLKKIGIKRVSLTTNASRLSQRLYELVDAGLDDLNISLDAVDPDVFLKMSGGQGNVNDVIRAVDQCRAANIPLKINSTLVRGINDSAVMDLLEFSMSRNIILRYIELMEMGPLFGKIKEKLFPAEDILNVISKKYKYEAIPRSKSSTAQHYKISDSDCEFGIISNVSEPFCSDCDRLRLSSNGTLFGCLSENHGFSIQGIDDNAFEDVLSMALMQKKKDGFIGSSLSMKEIGG